MARGGRILLFLGRFFLALIFLLSGLNKIFAWKQTASYMVSKEMPLVMLLLLGAIIVEIGGSLSLILGFWTRLGALALLFFLIAATLIFHNFWSYEGPERQAQMINFMKNLAIMGGLVLVLAIGAGSLSFDHKKSRATLSANRH